MEIYKKGHLRIIYGQSQEEADFIDAAISQAPCNHLEIVQCGLGVPLALAGQLHHEWEELLAGRREARMKPDLLCDLGTLDASENPYRVDPTIPRGDPGGGLRPILKGRQAEMGSSTSPVIVHMQLGMCSCGGVSENSSTNV